MTPEEQNKELRNALKWLIAYEDDRIQKEGMGYLKGSPRWDAWRNAREVFEKAGAL